jgi:HEAT repeat protein
VSESPPPPSQASGAGPLAGARELLKAGRAADLAERLLAVIGGEALWERDQVLDALPSLADGAALLEPLGEALRDPAAAERRNAARSAMAALAAQGSVAAAETLAVLSTLLREDRDIDVRVLAGTALGESGNPAAVLPLAAALADREPNVAAAAADALGVLGAPAALEPLVGAAREGDLWVRAAAIVSLGALGDRRAVPALREAVGDEFLAEAAATALGQIGEPEALDALRPLAERDHPARRAAQRAAARIIASHPKVQPPDWLRDSVAGMESRLADRLARGDEGAAVLLGIAGTEDAARILLAALDSPQSTAAAAALALLPAGPARRQFLPRLPGLAPEAQAAVLTALPALVDIESVEAVAALLGTNDEVTAAAVEALARSDESLVVPYLMRALERPRSRMAAVRALGRAGNVRCEPLASLLDDEDPAVRRAAAEGLSRCATPEIRAQLSVALSSERDAAARRALIDALGTSGGAEAVRELERHLDDPDAATRFAAVRALGHTRAPEALPPLVRVLAEQEHDFQAAALHALGELGDPRAAEPLARHLLDPDRDLRRAAAFAMRDLASPRAVEYLVAALGDPVWSVRHAAVRTLGAVGAVSALPDLERLATDDPDVMVRNAAREAVAALARPDDEHERTA